MTILATPEFKFEFEKLIKINSYSYLSKEIIETYFEKKIEDCLGGVRLNGHSPNPFLKKKLGGRGGSRLYLVAVVAKDKIYLSFIHPKAGSAGYENISNEKKTKLLDTLRECVLKYDLYELSCSEDRKNIIFTKQQE